MKSAFFRMGLSFIAATVLAIGLLYTFAPGLLDVPPRIEWSLSIYEPSEHGGFGEIYVTQEECETARNRFLEDSSYKPSKCDMHRYWIPRSAEESYPPVTRGWQILYVALPFVLYIVASARWGLPGLIGVYVGGAYVFTGIYFLSESFSKTGLSTNERIHDVVAPALTFYLDILSIIALLGGIIGLTVYLVRSRLFGAGNRPIET